MTIRTGVGAVLAFCAALGLGRWLFQQSPAQPVSRQPLAVGTRNIVPVSAASQMPSRPAQTSRAPGLNRSLTAVDGGTQNQNAKMTHFFASEYTEGTYHKVPAQFGASVRWVPQAQELWEGKELRAVLASAKPARGEMRAFGQLSQYVFPATYPDTAERFYVREDGGVEHDIVVKQPPVAVSEHADLAYSGILQLSHGLTLWDNTHQITGAYTTPHEVLVKNSMGNTVMVLHRPVAFDASVTAEDGTLDAAAQARSGRQQALTGCQYRFEFEDSGIKLAIITPGKWLSDPARAYPVTVDPVFGPFGLQDGNPPQYVGSVYTNTLIDATGGTKIPFRLCPIKPDNGVATVPMPFPFEYYGQPVTEMYVYIDGVVDFLVSNPCLPPALGQPMPSVRSPHIAAYWDDLRFGPAATTPNEADSAVYYILDGVAPDRRLIFEWHRMQYVSSSGSAEEISFNLIFYECENKFEVIIGRPGDVDMNRATVGMQDWLRTIGIQYTCQGGSAKPPEAPIDPGTAIMFRPAISAGLKVTPDSADGCAPLEVCFNATMTVPPVNCGSGDPVPPSYSYHWVIQPSSNSNVPTSEAFTPSFCHTFNAPGQYAVTLTITDSVGIKTTAPSITVRVCDTPKVIISVTPQGGPAPLMADMEVRTPLDTNLPLDKPPEWTIEQLGLNNEPGQAFRVASLSGEFVQYRFDQPGTYRVTATLTATDVALNLATVGVGTAYVFVTNSDYVIEDSMLITESKVKIDWKSKIPPANPNNIVPAPLPPNPNNDTISMKGFISLPGISTSMLIGKRVRVVLNGVQPLIDAVFNAGGVAVQGDQATGTTASLSISLPSGAFAFSAKGSLFGPLGVANVTQESLLAAQYRVEIEGLFPGPTLGPVIAYNYVSTAYKSATGSYKFGAPNSHKRAGKVKAGSSAPGGTPAFVSGAFMITDAKLKLEGKTVFARLKGFLARTGGDSLRPAATSDVIVSLGNFSEALNFSTTPAFKVSGKAPAQKFTFKRTGELGSAGIASLQWANQGGAFSITTFGLPNELVGLDPAQLRQALTLGLVISPESAAQFRASARFEVSKVSETDFVRSGKIK